MEASRFYQKYECGMSGWRWYRGFLHSHGDRMEWYVKVDTYAALDLVWC